jgi:hypothetical protein
VTIWARRARNGNSPSPGDLAEGLVVQALWVLPTTDWPTGAFGRRDRLAFLVHQRAAIPVHALVELQGGDVTVIGATVTVNTGKTSVPLAESLEDSAGPGLCVACAVLRRGGS